VAGHDFFAVEVHDGVHELVVFLDENGSSAKSGKKKVDARVGTAAGAVEAQAMVFFVFVFKDDAAAVGRDLDFAARVRQLIFDDDGG
jgi:hypothetical protein